jgi:hypothetical protein
MWKRTPLSTLYSYVYNVLRTHEYVILYMRCLNLLLNFFNVLQTRLFPFLSLSWTWRRKVPAGKILYLYIVVKKRRTVVCRRVVLATEAIK